MWEHLYAHAQMAVRPGLFAAVVNAKPPPLLKLLGYTILMQSCTVQRIL